MVAAALVVERRRFRGARAPCHSAEVLPAQPAAAAVGWPPASRRRRRRRVADSACKKCAHFSTQPKKMRTATLAAIAAVAAATRNPHWVQQAAPKVKVRGNATSFRGLARLDDAAAASRASFPQRHLVARGLLPPLVAGHAVFREPVPRLHSSRHVRLAPLRRRALRSGGAFLLAGPTPSVSSGFLLSCSGVWWQIFNMKDVGVSRHHAAAAAQLAAARTELLSQPVAARRPRPLPSWLPPQATP